MDHQQAQQVSRIEAKCDAILILLGNVFRKGEIMQAEIVTLIAQVAATKTAEASAIVAINGILDRLTAAIAATPSLSTEDRAALLQVTSDLKASTDPLAAAVVAIPAPAPPVVPAP